MGANAHWRRRVRWPAVGAVAAVVSAVFAVGGYIPGLEPRETTRFVFVPAPPTMARTTAGSAIVGSATPTPSVSAAAPGNSTGGSPDCVRAYDPGAEFRVLAGCLVSGVVAVNCQALFDSGQSSTDLLIRFTQQADVTCPYGCSSLSEDEALAFAERTHALGHTLQYGGVVNWPMTTIIHDPANNTQADAPRPIKNIGS